MSSNAREAILEAAKRTAQAHGYGGLNFRELAKEVGIKGASIHYYYPTKAELGAAVAKRYWQDSDVVLETLWAECGDPASFLHAYPATFRKALENDNRMCLCSFMSAELDDLPEEVKTEVLAFADVNVKWLAKALMSVGSLDVEQSHRRARAIFAAISGAQLTARSRSDIAIFDSLVETYRESGLIP